MLLLLNLLFALASSVLFGIYSTGSTGFLRVLAAIGVFFGSYLAFLVMAFAFLLIVFIVFEKSDTKRLFKHFLMNEFSLYFYTLFLRVKLVVTGRENLPKNDNFVIFCNHIEATDPMFIKLVYKKHPLAFISKEVLFTTFPIKTVLNGLGCIPISPKADRSALQSILASIKKVQSGQPMAIFPEGKRTYSNHLIEFKPGSFKVPQKAGADISPCAVYGMHEIFRKGRILPVTVHLAVLPMIPYAQYKDMDTVEVARVVQEVVQEQMDLFAQAQQKKLEKQVS